MNLTEAIPLHSNKFVLRALFRVPQRTQTIDIFWQHNLNACAMAVFSTEWFHQCFIPEVKEYLEKGGLTLKILLITDNAPGHIQSVSIEDQSVQVVFWPPNPTSQLQPLHQGVIRCVKSAYTRQVFETIGAAIDADPNLQFMNCWK
jgi:hypothetical protein